MKIKNSESLVFCETYEVIDSKKIPIRDIHSDIKLFKIELSKYFNIVDYLINFLTSNEIDRAQRYRHTKDRNRFIICRSLLKYLLAKETNLEISKIQFKKTENKKPYFPLDTSLFFNISHAGNYAIIAIGPCELGVDIEFVDKDFNFHEILGSVYNESEINIINNFDNKRYSFYKFWTRKEAIVKAIGKGIDDDLKNIPVTDGFHSVPSTLIYGFKKINVFSFNINNDYVGALALTEDATNFDKIVFQPLPTSDQLKLTFQNNN